MWQVIAGESGRGANGHGAICHGASEEHWHGGCLVKRHCNGGLVNHH